jgi:hypothetical protein
MLMESCMLISRPGPDNADFAEFLAQNYERKTCLPGAA